jgi:hypothetical protein
MVGRLPPLDGRRRACTFTRRLDRCAPIKSFLDSSPCALALFRTGSDRFRLFTLGSMAGVSSREPPNCGPIERLAALREQRQETIAQEARQRHWHAKSFSRSEREANVLVSQRRRERGGLESALGDQYPRPAGNIGDSTYLSLRHIESARLMPIALTLIRTSCDPGAGVSTSMNSRTSGPPG